MVSPHFATCHISELTNPFLPLPPLQKANPHFQHAMFPSSPTCFSSSSPPGSESSFCDVPCFRAHQPTPPSSSPPESDSSFCATLPFLPNHPTLPSLSSPRSVSCFVLPFISKISTTPFPPFIQSSMS